MSQTHKCPHPQCDQLVAEDQFACQLHWLRMPLHLRHLITKRYRDFTKFRSMYHWRALKEIWAEGLEYLKSEEMAEKMARARKPEEAHTKVTKDAKEGGEK